MLSFPPKDWEVRYLTDMDLLTAPEADKGQINMEAYMAIRPSAGEEGRFRFSLTGVDNLRLYFPVNEVLPAEDFKGMFVEALLDTDEHIKLEHNSACSKWLDIVELVRSQDADILDGQGEVVSEQFLTLMENYKKTAPTERSGICLRWLLGVVGDSVDVALIAQALPCSIEAIEANPVLRTDHTMGVLIKKFPVQYER